MKRLFCFSILTLLLAGPLQAAEHEACRNPDSAHQGLSADALGAIARSCSEPAVARLFQRREVHQRLLASSRILARVESASRAIHGGNPESVRLYMALVEVMAPIWYPGRTERIAFLTAEYERRNRIAELRLRGYEHAAARLEREYVAN